MNLGQKCISIASKNLTRSLSWPSLTPLLALENEAEQRILDLEKLKPLGMQLENLRQAPEWTRTLGFYGFLMLSVAFSGEESLVWIEMLFDVVLLLFLAVFLFKKLSEVDQATNGQGGRSPMENLELAKGWFMGLWDAVEVYTRSIYRWWMVV